MVWTALSTTMRGAARAWISADIAGVIPVSPVMLPEGATLILEDAAAVSSHGNRHCRIACMSDAITSKSCASVMPHSPVMGGTGIVEPELAARTRTFLQH